MGGNVFPECFFFESTLYFSNPNVLDELGVPTGAPNHDNAQVMTTHMLLIAEFNQGPYAPSERTFCLQDGRFAVEVDWRIPNGNIGIGRRVDGVSSPDSALFYFFNPNNREMLVKVLDNCNGATNRFWVFAAATTNVEYTLTVTNTETGLVREYFNPQGVFSPAITDTQTFATCP